MILMNKNGHTKRTNMKATILKGDKISPYSMKLPEPKPMNMKSTFPNTG